MRAPSTITPPPRRRRIALIGGGAVLLVALLLRCGHPSGVPAVLPPSAALPGLAAVAALPPGPNESVEPVEPPARRGPAPAAPIIDGVDVEKTEVCEGEDSLVTVRAHTPGHHDDGYLHYVVAGQPGRIAPVRPRRRDTSEGTPPPRTIRVFGRNNVVTEVPLPEIRVKDCRVPRRIDIVVRALPNREDDFELYARLVDVATTTRMRPVQARWDFGDGAAAESTGPVIEHSFSGRRQDTLFSQFLIQVEIVAADGERVRGRTSLQLLNSAYEHLNYRGLVRLSSALSPRFPVLDAAGVVRQRVRVGHHHDQPVRVERIWRRQHRRDGDAVSAAEPVDPVSVLGAPIVPATGVEIALSLDTRAHPDVTAVEYTLEGRSDDGWPVAGAFTLMRPPDAPRADNSAPITDPALKARIVRARQLLARPYVTDEDLWRLDKEGAFADLPAVSDAPPPSKP